MTLSDAHQWTVGTLLGGSRVTFFKYLLFPAITTLCHANFLVTCYRWKCKCECILTLSNGTTMKRVMQLELSLFLWHNARRRHRKFTSISGNIEKRCSAALFYSRAMFAWMSDDFFHFCFRCILITKELYPEWNLLFRSYCFICDLCLLLFFETDPRNNDSFWQWKTSGMAALNKKLKILSLGIFLMVVYIFGVQKVRNNYWHCHHNV